MAAILLIAIYISYIGLGVPDSLLGSAWPAIYREFGVTVSSVSIVSFIVSCGTVTSSLLSVRIVNRFGTGRTAALSTALTAMALLGFSLSPNMLCLCVSAVPLGLGAGGIDAAVNNYVALHYKATHMNFLHCSYGVGVSLSPYLMSLALSDSSDWRQGYRTMFFIQAGITAVMIAALPLWKKLGEKTESEKKKKRVLGIAEMLKMPKVRANCGVFIGSCALESTCLVWGATYLAEGKGMNPAMAAKMITLYFIGMALGRFLSGVASSKLSCKTLVIIGQGIAFASIIALLLPLPAIAASVGLLAVGFGNGAVFPNMTHLTPITFGKEISQSVIGLQMALAYVAVMLAPPTFGVIARYFSVSLFPLYLLIMFMLMLTATAVLFKRTKE